MLSHIFFSISHGVQWVIKNEIKTNTTDILLISLFCVHHFMLQEKNEPHLNPSQKTSRKKELMVNYQIYFFLWGEQGERDNIKNEACPRLFFLITLTLFFWLLQITNIFLHVNPIYPSVVCVTDSKKEMKVSTEDWQDLYFISYFVSESCV